jgi:hypothetical protein
VSVAHAAACAAWILPLQLRAFADAVISQGSPVRDKKSSSDTDAQETETLRALGSTLRAVQKLLEGSVGECLSAMRGDFDAVSSRLQRMEAKLEGMDPKLDEIAQAIGIEKHNVSAGDDEEDRKRIKEKLREALEDNYERSKRNTKKQDFMEYFFGICKTNGRVGKIGSRFVLSAFFALHVAFVSEGENLMHAAGVPWQADPSAVGFHAR